MAKDQSKKPASNEDIAGMSAAMRAMSIGQVGRGMELAGMSGQMRVVS